MMLDSYPVFRKDFRVLLRFAAGTLAVQGLLAILTELRPHWFLAPMRLEDVFPKLQVMLSIIIALVAAGHFLAEEREGGTDRFLFRLAAERRRLFAEKAAAGLAIVMLTLVCQFLWGSAGERITGLRFWGPTDVPQISVLLASTSLFAYLVGLPLSIVFHRTVHVVLVGMFIPLGGIWITRLPWAAISPTVPYLLYIFLAVAVPVVALSVSRGIGSGRFPAVTRGRGAVAALAWKQTEEKTVTAIVVGIVVLAALASRFLIAGEEKYLAAFPIVVLSAALGATTYSREEKDGARCVLYHHPVSRSRVFWVKFCHGLIGAAVLCGALAMLMVPTDRDMSHPPGELAAYVGWCGLVPYLCGALFTHAFTLPLYATIATLFSLPVLAWVVIYARVYKAAETVMITGEFPFFFAGPVLLICVGITLAAWRAATDRSLATGNGLFRTVYVARLFLFALAAVTILTKTGWRDLFYLVTGIDPGAG